MANLERVEEEGGGVTKTSVFLIKPLFGLIDLGGGVRQSFIRVI